MNLFKRIISSIILLILLYFFIFIKSIYFIYFIFFCFIISLFEWFNLTKEIYFRIFGVIFLIFSFLSIFFLKTLDNSTNNFDLILLTLLICISSDIGGYIFGKILKGPKLTKISPNKTYGGVFGAFILTISSLIFIEKYNIFPHLNNHFYKLVIISLLISAASQLGDIIVSFFKRKANLKDTGSLIPGHGGLLDRIDGMIFAFPTSLILFKIF